ncbi:hypothetical protein [Pyrobaculum aerophilum]|uniref:Uncharacterized protein n=2 Tax=Pyrobaculum aerophilum TaxID=13773 RepID=Q8ZYS6_PYRAE|nr:MULTISPECIES: hypothetical protein [Pyrobaculum]AAL62917.1 hypothetical protein PAE0644 [Pyrobaculum aerophilum str. IM2]MCX8135885.1 hypothetical protein [Pyrobaculum aerophilum]HII46052.1 hypothetical protein [Pyrobaculum aerophilum]
MPIFILVGNLYAARGVAICKSCGFAAPALDMCRVTETCVICARERLGDKCNLCPDKERCDAAIDGLRFLKSLEPRLDVYIDLGKHVARMLEPYDRVELGIAFLKSLMGLVKLLQRERKERAFPVWIASVLRDDVVSKLVRVPYVVKIDLYRPLKEFCAVFNCSGLEAPLNNLLNAVVSLSMIEKTGDPTRYFRLGV